MGRDGEGDNDDDIVIITGPLSSIFQPCNCNRSTYKSTIANKITNNNKANNNNNRNAF